MTFINCRTRAESSASNTSCDSALHESMISSHRTLIQFKINMAVLSFLSYRDDLPTTSRLFYFYNRSDNMNNPSKFGFNDREFTFGTGLNPRFFLLRSIER